MLRKLNPAALIVSSHQGVVDLTDVLAVWSQAGPNLTFEPGELIGTSDAVGQELVFIGLGVTVTDTYRRLDPALLTDDELAAGPDTWRLLPDPLPLWDDSDLHDHGAHAQPAR